MPGPFVFAVNFQNDRGRPRQVAGQFHQIHISKMEIKYPILPTDFISLPDIDLKREYYTLTTIIEIYIVERGKYMKLKWNLFPISLALISAATTPALAEPLTLDAVIMLAGTGLGDEAVIAKIKTSETHYDLSVEQMLELKKKGVSGPIIAALMSTDTSKAAPAKFSIDSPDPAQLHPAGVYLVDEGANRMIRIDATVTNQVKTGGILGYAFSGGLASASLKAAVQNAHARTRSAGQQPTFYFFFDESNPQQGSAPQTWASGTAATVSSPSEFTLIKLTEKDGRRETRVGSFNIAGSKAGVMDKDRIAFDYTMVRPGVYRAKPQAPLAKGEYGFMYSLTGGGAAGAITARIFDFGVP